MTHTFTANAADGSPIEIGIAHLDALNDMQAAVIETLTNFAPEGGIWTLERLAAQLGAPVGYKRFIFDTAIEGLAGRDEIVTDGEDIILA